MARITSRPRSAEVKLTVALRFVPGEDHRDTHELVAGVARDLSAMV